MLLKSLKFSENIYNTKGFLSSQKEEEQAVLLTAGEQNRGGVPTFREHFCLLPSHHLLHPAELQVVVVVPGVALDTLGHVTHCSRCPCTRKDVLL